MRLAALVAALLVAGCGGRDDKLVVSAASSLNPSLASYAERFGDVRMSFSGSDGLAAQIRRGVRPDVYAAANEELPAALHREGLVARPVTFAANRVVIAVARDSPHRRLEDVVRADGRFAIGAPSVPVGAYAEHMLGMLPRPLRAAVLDRVRSTEPDVAGIVGKIRNGVVDAGFVYATDLRASGGLLRELPGPPVRVYYAAAVVDGAGERARNFVDGLREAEELRAAGFERP